MTGTGRFFPVLILKLENILYDVWDFAGSEDKRFFVLPIFIPAGGRRRASCVATTVIATGCTRI